MRKEFSLTYFPLLTYSFIFTHFLLPTYPFVFMRGELLRVSDQWSVVGGSFWIPLWKRGILQLTHFPLTHLPIY